MDYFVKKTWIRIAVCAVLVAVGVLAMTGVFSGNQPLKYDPASVNGATVVSAEATEQGFGVPTRSSRSSSSARPAPSPSERTELKP